VCSTIVRRTARGRKQAESQPFLGDDVEQKSKENCAFW
jgi:hypothetical protein